MKKIIMTTLSFAALLAAGLNVPHRFTAEFNQSVANPDGNTTLTYRGDLAVVLPDTAKWRYKTPVPKTICVAGPRVWVIEPELEQATLYHMGGSIPIFRIFRHAKRQIDGTYLAAYRGRDYRIVVDQKERPVQIRYRDDLGNRVTLTFSHLVPKIDDPSRLKCDIPDDYDIVDTQY